MQKIALPSPVTAEQIQALAEPVRLNKNPVKSLTNVSATVASLYAVAAMSGLTDQLPLPEDVQKLFDAAVIVAGWLLTLIGRWRAGGLAWSK